MPWMDRNLGRLIAGLLIVLAIGCALLAKSCADQRTARSKAAVAEGQAAAATASGRDAATTVADRAAIDATTDQLTRENADAIRQAKGADAPVDPAVRDAGFSGLCRRAAYSQHPRCLQHARP
jgi:hypothetical protein